MNPLPQHGQEWFSTRRQFLSRSGAGLGSLALASMLADEGRAVEPSVERSLPHFAPRAKRVISLHMVGGPSHLDLLEYKPALVKHNGQPVPQELIEGQRFAFLRGRPQLLGTRYQFPKCGQAGLEISELLPHLQKVADELCVVKTLHTEEFNHAPAQLFLQTGFGRFGRPSLGSWLSYGLGAENQNLPAFVVMLSGALAGAGSSLWGSGFLPTLHQGVEFRTSGDPVLFLSNPKGVDDEARRRSVEAIQRLNQQQLADVGDPEIATRIAQYEMAFRMQTSVPELMNLAGETKQTLDLYGATPGKASFANNCLLARRLVERGVRFVQLYDDGWDHHSNVFGNLPKACYRVDRPMAALVADLKQRGLLDETLVLWGGEFGRTPMLQGVGDDNKPNAQPGRDHHKDAFSVWLAGGGVKGGTVYGKTDDLGYYPVEDKMHVNDYHATILHLLGLDHERLTFKYQGRQFRLTDVAGKVARKMLA